MAQDLAVFGNVGADEIAVALFLVADIFEAEFQSRDFFRIDVPDQPGIGIAAVIAPLHDFGPGIERAGVLGRAAHAREFGNAVGIEAIELPDGGFGADDPGIGDKKVGAAVNPAGGSLPKDAMSVRRFDVL